MVGFRLVERPEGVASRYRYLVVDLTGLPHKALTRFFDRAQQELTEGAARTYLNAILPFFEYLETDPWRRRRGDRWDVSPVEVRESVRDYLMQWLGCKVRPQGSFQSVRLTAASPSTVRVFLSGLKCFYRHAIELGLYEHESPLLDRVAFMQQQVSREAEREQRGRPVMPQLSGVEEPASRRRPSDNYFRVVDDDWVPVPIDDPKLPLRVLEGVRLASLGLRDLVVVRMIFESGARVSEVLGLTVGDWRKRGMKREATAFSKGSRGRRVKFLRFSHETTKLLHRYVREERRQLDPYGRTLDQLQDTDPLFLSARKRAYGYKAFIPRWNAACKAVGLDLNVHGLRHWYVTQAMREIYESSSTQAEVERRKEELVRYMAWRSPTTLEAYEHYFEAWQHAEIQDRLLRRIYARDSRYARTSSVARRAGSSPRQMPEPQEDSWDSLLALGGGRDG